MTNNLRIGSIIQGFREAHGLDRETWQRYAIFLARCYLDAAPEEARLQFMGPPSHISPQAKELAEVFAMLHTKAEDKAKAVSVQYSMVDLWSSALQLQEVCHV